MLGSAIQRVIALGVNKFCQSNAFQFDEDVRQLFVGWTHNVAVLKDNRILMWGRNFYGQLGIGAFSENQATPAPLCMPDAVAAPAHVHLGSENGLFRTTAGEVYTWGWNEHGNCGNNTTEKICKPTLIKLPTVARLAGTGAGFCYAICEA